ncbi:GntR family transcriptional regulator [Collinsella sp. AGMB00827]|uniref:GntR family transcriptional regulator n=1 Tax=Collinsella ureilytica TaxID=2869515 RepID=A0ABS7MJH5_9ACTN|nr:GntR family transcriptional regulator [Collinsella urealyticum]MBY4797516.1 GntR family transcriptional regulator [Collinsella urealyticum]
MLKYEAIAEDLRKQIEDGTLGQNERLPTVVELCHAYGVSKITIRRAMERLKKDGLVSSRRGSGTFVKRSASFEENPLVTGLNEHAEGFTAQHAKAGDAVSSEVYDFAVITPPAEVAELLGLSAEDFTYYHCRTRIANDLPIAIEYTYMSLALIPGLKLHHLYESVYRYLREEVGLKLGSFHRAIRAVPATEEEATRLKTEPGAPLLELEQVGYLDSGIPFEYSRTRNVGSRYVLNNITLA